MLTLVPRRGSDALRTAARPRDAPNARLPEPLQRVFGNRAIARYEEEAERSAARVMNGASAPPAADGALAPAGGGGTPLAAEVREFMEPRLGFEFGNVRVHTGSDAAARSRHLHARAFSRGRDIYFGAGASPGRNAETAHELTHVMQQASGPSGDVPGVQRIIELRPPGRGEASAFDRADELIDRLNALSQGVDYSLVGNEIHFEVVDAAQVTPFDRRMEDFINRAEVVPLRLITHAGRVGPVGGPFGPLRADSFIAGYVDLDDLLADDDHSFQSTMVHFLTERFQVPRYAHLIGMDAVLGPLFDRAHAAGRDAEAALLQDVIGDPSIRFVYDEMKPGGNTFVRGFRSHDEGYYVFRVIHNVRAELAPAVMWVQTVDRRHLSIEDFIAERAAAGP